MVLCKRSRIPFVELARSFCLINIINRQIKLIVVLSNVLTLCLLCWSACEALAA